MLSIRSSPYSEAAVLHQPLLITIQINAKIPRIGVAAIFVISLLYAAVEYKGLGHPKPLLR